MVEIGVVTHLQNVVAWPVEQVMQVVPLLHPSTHWLPPPDQWHTRISCERRQYSLNKSHTYIQVLAIGQGAFQIHWNCFLRIPTTKALRPLPYLSPDQKY